MIDRMEFPRRYKLKDSMIILVMLALLFGVWLNNNTQKRILRKVLISEITIVDYSSQHVEISYKVENKLQKDLELRLLAKVFDAKGAELASAMYTMEIGASQTLHYSKIFDTLNRALAEGEAPAKAVVSIYPRKAI
ncbi:MAG TPA: hypothetical protein PLX59_04505 [Candidatus Cloacimonadota bacterium]|nr:hypothetical protein [Candidatus Cloacimonadota bacterium]